jgi:hypothetical protein
MDCSIHLVLRLGCRQKKESRTKDQAERVAGEHLRIEVEPIEAQRAEGERLRLEAGRAATERSTTVHLGLWAGVSGGVRLVDPDAAAVALSVVDTDYKGEC